MLFDLILNKKWNMLVFKHDNVQFSLPRHMITITGDTTPYGKPRQVPFFPD